MGFITKVFAYVCTVLLVSSYAVLLVIIALTIPSRALEATLIGAGGVVKKREVVQ